MNWVHLSFGLGIMIPALLLPFQSAANCMLFTHLRELDKRAMSYLASEADEEQERRLSLMWASVSIDHLLENDLDSDGLVSFLNLRRELAYAIRPPQTNSARDEMQARMHRTRGDLLRYGEAWGCIRNSEHAEPVAGDLSAASRPPGRSPAATNDLIAGSSPGGQVGEYRDRRLAASSLPVDPRDRRVLALARDHPGTGAAAIGWLLGLGVCLATAGMVWEERRSRMGERHVCRVPCILRTKSNVARAEIIDISRSGAKIRVSGFPVKEGESIDVLMQEHRIGMTVAWKSEHFFGGPFKKPISRKMVDSVSHGIQLRYGAAARGKGLSSERPPLQS